MKSNEIEWAERNHPNHIQMNKIKWHQLKLRGIRWNQSRSNGSTCTWVQGIPGESKSGPLLSNFSWPHRYIYIYICIYIYIYYNKMYLIYVYIYIYIYIYGPGMEPQTTYVCIYIYIYIWINLSLSIYICYIILYIRPRHETPNNVFL